jgi:hypothetical protein
MVWPILRFAARARCGQNTQPWTAKVRQMDVRVAHADCAKFSRKGAEKHSGNGPLHNADPGCRASSALNVRVSLKNAYCRIGNQILGFTRLDQPVWRLRASVFQSWEVAMLRTEVFPSMWRRITQ